MTGFYNPTSSKTQWGSGLQELLGNIAQYILISKMGKDGGQQQLPPGAASAMGGAGAQGGMPMPQGGGQASMGQRPPMPQGPPPQQRPPMPTGSPMGQSPMGGQMGGGQGGPPQMQMAQMGGQKPQGNSILSPQDIQMLSSQMPPELMQIILKLLGEGKFTQPKMG